MKKIFLTIAFIASGLVASAQVGVGTTDPQVSLQVDKSAVTTDADGVLVPRVSVADLNAKTAYYLAAQNGTLVFVNDLTGTAAGKTVDVTATGFYYYSAGTVNKWVALGGSAFKSVVLSKDSSYTALDVSEVTPNNVTTVTFTASGPANFTITNLGAGDVGKILNFYNATGSSVNATFDPAGTPTSASLSILGSRGYSLVWTATGWARTSY